MSVNVDEPFFLVGCLRSGTTLLRLVLGHHSQICRCEEFEFVAPMIGPTGPALPIDEYHQFLRNDRGFQAAGYQIDPDLTQFELAMNFLVQRQALDNKPIVGAAVHHGFDRLSAVWPRAKYIHLLRDPRDVARSCVGMGWAGNSWGGAQIWIDAYSAYERLRDQCAPDDILEVHYENLISRPTGVLEQICEFLNVDFEPEMLEIERDTTYSKPDPNVASSWKTADDREGIAQVEARIGRRRLIESGYTPSDVPSLSAGPFTKSALEIQNRTGRALFRINRYGLSLWVQMALAKRLPISALREHAQRQMNAVDQKYLK